LSESPNTPVKKRGLLSARLSWAAFLQAALTVMTPVLLCLVSVRLVMTPLFLQVVYHLPDFPDDPYGFSLDDRLTYAPYALTYLFNSADISYLSDLRLPKNLCVGIPFESDTCSLFNAQELRHMRDVKTVTRHVFGLMIVTGVLMAAAVWFKWRNRPYRRILRLGLLNGGIVTIGLIAVIVFGAVFNWDFFFSSFHSTFFESGTWRFAYSDTLIRLFPERFWFDAALSIGGLVVGSAAIIVVVMLPWNPETDVQAT
jgi:integral membrane protein (TIGR01906 family)